MGSELKSITGLGLSKPNTYPNMERITYEPAKLRSIDINIKIVECSICGANPHYARGDWDGPHLPIIPGHEMIGYIVNKGSDISDDDFKIGDRVGVGAKADCYGSCYRCSHSFENNCRNFVFTYGNFVPMPCRQGGYASHVRLNSKFVIKIPNNISSEHAAPLLCGGMTGLSPLLITGVGKGTRVAICGIGGIRHSSIMFAKALGADVTAISNSDEKKQLAVDLGADHFISHDPEYAQKNVDAFDVIVHTGSFIAVSLAVTLSGLRVTVW